MGVAFSGTGAVYIITHYTQHAQAPMSPGNLPIDDQPANPDPLSSRSTCDAASGRPIWSGSIVPGRPIQGCPISENPSCSASSSVVPYGSSFDPNALSIPDDPGKGSKREGFKGEPFSYEQLVEQDYQAQQKKIKLSDPHISIPILNQVMEAVERIRFGPIISARFKRSEPF